MAGNTIFTSKLKLLPVVGYSAIALLIIPAFIFGYKFCFTVSLRLSAGKALDLNGRVTGYIVEFLALAK